MRRHDNILIYLNIATIAAIILITAAINTINSAIIAPIVSYFNAVWSGSEASYWPHVVFVPLSILAGVAVGVGIIFDRPKFSETVQILAFWLIVVGVPTESTSTVLLFVIDERISIALTQRLAARTLTGYQIVDIGNRLSKFDGQEFEVITYWDDKEALNISQQISDSLVLSGWIDDQPKRYTSMIGVTAGVVVLVDEGAPKRVKDAASALTDALNTQDLDATEKPEPVSPNIAPSSKIQINIGIKP